MRAIEDRSDGELPGDGELARDEGPGTQGAAGRTEGPPQESDLAAPRADEHPLADDDLPIASSGDGAALRARRAWPAWVTRLGLDPLAVVGFLLVAGGVLATFIKMHPELIFARTTATGGDMGAHVWAGDFVRRELFPQFRLTGWSDDWYAGFPVLGFYFPAPTLVIALLSFVLPYQVAFKLVTVLGIVGLPVAAWAFGHLARLRRPIPVLLGLAAFPFLFDRQFTIYGGNIASTMAGEFSFSISLALGILFLGLLAHVLRTGERRGVAAVLLALTGLCHLLPTIFVLVTAVLLILALQSPPRELRRLAWGINAVCVGGLVLAAIAFHFLGSFPGVFVAVAVLAAADVAALVLDRRGVRIQTLDAAVVLSVGGALAGFWLVPFKFHLPFSNDMGWEKLTQYVANLFPFWAAKPPAGAAVAGGALVLAAIGGVWVLGRLWQAALDRRPVDVTERVGAVLLIVGIASGLLFRFMPQFRLWNARVLPFWFLIAYLLGAYGVFAIGRALVSLSQWHSEGRRSWRHAPVAGTLVAGFAVWLAVGVPLDLVPGWMPIPKVTKGMVGVQRTAATHDRSFAPGWASWNFSGYERKGSWEEYRALMQTSINLGRTNGCGRAMWDYEGGLDRFGTPMGLMLLPYWTHGCIRSMEGLYFESSATTPYHFMNAALVSNSPSNPQRELPYPTFDLAKGVEKLQEFGVRYYYTFSGRGQKAARAIPDLKLVATSTPLNRTCPDAEKDTWGCPAQWEIYEIANSDLVAPLSYQPAVATNVGPSQHDGWLDLGVTLYKQPELFPLPLVADGPNAWERVRVDFDDQSGGVHTWGDGTIIAQAERVPLEKVTVTDIRQTEDSVRFRVDKTGVPVVVKISYFPNWKASGAEGPYRLSPNFMVVIPTGNDVHLSFGYSGADKLGWLLTFGGIGAVVLLAVLDRRRRKRPRPHGGLGGVPVGSASDPEHADAPAAEPTDTDATDPDGIDADGTDGDAMDPAPSESWRSPSPRRADEPDEIP